MKKYYLVLWIAMLSGCNDESAESKFPLQLLEEPWSQFWVSSAIPDQGAVQVQDGQIIIEAGAPMSGATWRADQAGITLPVVDYVLSYEACRVAGNDFFGTVTFPVLNSNQHLTLVLGGWGGGLVGLSNIDHLDASENGTRSEMRFENGVWYAVRIEVRADEIFVTLDNKPMVRTSIRGRTLSLRAGDIDHCLPLGFATWRTQGQIRNITLQKLRS